MKPYIILNGQHSKEIEGLLISTLPPISKPKIRTNITEIDGRDGDIVEVLGYSAYDKSFEIGLTYGYDIDDVIAFFDSQGTVVFSNEEDKYYNYQILEQIDFEKLIRFKTATVTMHVQPFKYSDAENDEVFEANSNLLSIPNYTRTTNGITLTVNNGVITVSGTGSSATEFYVPIDSVNLSAGDYTLSATSSGTYASTSSIRLINEVPSDPNSFGNAYLGLQNNATATLNASLNASATYNYLWFYITAGTEMNYTLNVALTGGVQYFTIRNSGNIYSKPTLEVIGTGVIGIYLNGTQIFVIDMQNTSQIIVDTVGMNAYYSDGTYANRIVTGDYDDFRLDVGANTIMVTGGIEQLTLSNYSRWI